MSETTRSDEAANQSTPLTVHTTLVPRGPACAIVLSDEQTAQLGGGKRAAVLVRIGQASARLRVAVMGGETLIGMSKAARTTLGVEIGQEVDAEISLDGAPREIAVPEDLASALDDVAAAAFAALSPSRRTELVTWVESAKRAETRERRIASVVEQMRTSR